MQEIQGAGHVLHDHAGLQLIKVSSLVNVAQDGAWGQAMMEGKKCVRIISCLLYTSDAADDWLVV